MRAAKELWRICTRVKDAQGDFILFLFFFFSNPILTDCLINGAGVPTGPGVAGVTLVSQHESDSEFTPIIFPCAVMRRQELIVQHCEYEIKAAVKLDSMIP